MAPDRLRSDQGVDASGSSPQVVVLDANSLLMPFQFKLNIDLQLADLLGPSFKVVVLSTVRDEVYGLAKGGDKHAKVALKLLEKYELVEWRGKGDTAIVNYAKRFPKCIVVTNDKQLRRRLAGLGVKRIMLFSKKRLGWDE